MRSSMNSTLDRDMTRALMAHGRLQIVCVALTDVAYGGERLVVIRQEQGLADAMH